MSAPIYQTPSLYEALKAEGYILPDECADIKLILPVDGHMQFEMLINIRPEDLAKIGRALVRLSVKK